MKDYIATIRIKGSLIKTVVHADNLSKMCKYSKALTKEFEQMHEDINRMALEMQYEPNVKNMPDLPAALGIPKK